MSVRCITNDTKSLRTSMVVVIFDKSENDNISQMTAELCILTAHIIVSRRCTVEADIRNDSWIVHFDSRWYFAELKCPRHWDHLLCWPEANAGERLSIPCKASKAFVELVIQTRPKTDTQLIPGIFLQNNYK